MQRRTVLAPGVSRVGRGVDSLCNRIGPHQFAFICRGRDRHPRLVRCGRKRPRRAHVRRSENASGSTASYGTCAGHSSSIGRAGDGGPTLRRRRGRAPSSAGVGRAKDLGGSRYEQDSPIGRTGNGVTHDSSIGRAAQRPGGSRVCRDVNRFSALHESGQSVAIRRGGDRYPVRHECSSYRPHLCVRRSS